MMKQFQGWYLPASETHLTEWLSHPKNQVQLNGRLAYQGRKQMAALALCQQFRTAVDVGAHVGFWSYNLAKKFTKVMSFEPVVLHRLCFEANVSAQNVTLFSRALGDRNAMVSMHTAPTSSGDTWVNGPGGIPMDKLDDYNFNDVDFIKLDCEGYELNVLRGAEETLKRCHPAVCVEQKPGKATHFGLPTIGAVEYLQSLGAKLRKEISGDYFLSWD